MKTHFSVLLVSLAFLSLQLQASPVAPPFTSTNIDTQNLINFKNALPNPALLQNWFPNQNPCTFSGVKCQETNRVSSVDLSSISVNTDFHTVATFLLTLDKLERLSLKSNNISGSISFPSGSKCSSVLSNLDLSHNVLSGPVSDIASLGSCVSLKSLNLANNSLDFSLKGKSSGLRLSLESLDLSFNKISGSNVVPFILSGGCNELQYFSLKGNKVSGDLDVSNCKNLQFLDVSSNNFSASVPSFGDCLALEHLDISSNEFYGDLGRAIGGCAKLKFLNVSTNQFSGSIPVLPTGNLQFLYLGGNHFLGEIPLHLTEACPGLVELDLSSNYNLTGSVPSSFAACTSLEYFDISSNNFSGDLPIDTLLKMTSLKNIDFSFNGFTGGLPDSLSKLTSMESLDLSSNNLSGLIPARLCEDPSNNLKELFLQDNWFFGSIPASLSNCSQLTSLHLSFNLLTGTIPSSLGSLSKLRDLKLWLNKLHGDIPPEIMNIQTLETLILDFNELTGVIPSSISNCTKLNWISLSNNRLTGEIPASIGKLSSLTILKLSNNSFYGRIPPELGDCPSLIWLDLNTNFLNGTIPPELFKQSGNIAVNFITGKRYVYLKNMKSEWCHGEGNLLEFAGIRPEQLDRISTRHPCNFTRVYGGHTQPLCISQYLTKMDLRESIRHQTDVALGLSKHVLLTEAKTSNSVFCPQSILVVLSLIAAGSKGPTLDQLLSFLKSKSNDLLSSFSSQLVSVVFADGSASGGPRLSFANGVWVDNSLSLKPSFKQVVDNVYKAASNQVDFQNKAVEVTNEVNAWAEKETNGLIKEVLPSGSVDHTTRLIFANALYFKGAWNEKFDASTTKDNDFYLLNGSSVHVPFMSSKKKQFISGFDGFKVLGLPYKQGEDKRQFSMYIFLPDAKDGLSALVEKVGSESGFVDHHLPQKKVEVDDFRIPRFKISFGFEASKTLKGLGLVLPFSGGDLTEMVDSSVGQNLYVSSIYHKSFIEVNEEGTEAAAASAGVISYRGLTPKMDFVADHPFLFLVREDMTGLVLFIGHMLDPSQAN